MNRVIAVLAFSLVQTAALIGIGYGWGHSNSEKEWIARHAVAAEAAVTAIAKESERADQAATSYLTDHLDQQDSYDALDAKYQALRTRAPLVVYRAAPPAAGIVAPSTAQGSGELPAAADAGAVPVLTLAAVRMWNGALTGQDAAAGACGHAGGTEGADAACAEDAGLTLDDAWANHRANAKSCADDRLRYRHLIDYLKQNQGD